MEEFVPRALMGARSSLAREPPGGSSLPSPPAIAEAMQAVAGPQNERRIAHGPEGPEARPGLTIGLARRARPRQVSLERR